jgi:hypothetical protein
MDSSVLPKVSALVGPGDFTHEPNILIFLAILDLHGENRGFDAAGVAGELRRRGQYERACEFGGLADLFDLVPSGKGAIDDARIVRALADARHSDEEAPSFHSSLMPVDPPYAPASASTTDDRGEPAEEIESERILPVPRTWPDPLHPAALHGLAGEIVTRVAPHTESDPVALLVQLLIAFGNLVGRRPRWRVEATDHHLNLFGVIVGRSAKARKGTGLDHVLRLLASCDPAWRSDCVQGGLATGEGLVWLVRDPDPRDRVRRGSPDPAVPTTGALPPDPRDRRLLVVESEFGATLATLSREGNSLSGILRQAWDGGTLRSLSKNRPARATGAHISVIGHVTAEEVTPRLSRLDARNGFANRFLWVCARRSRFLPHGGRIHEVDFTGLLERLDRAVAWSRQTDRTLHRDDGADRLWEASYPDLSVSKPGLVGSITSRAEAQVMRLAAAYAVLEVSETIRVEHMRAALAVWRYCEQSAAHIFGNSLVDPRAEKLLSALRAAGSDGLSRTQIYTGVFACNESSADLGRLLDQLSTRGLARRDPISSDTRRPTHRWFATAAEPPERGPT